jgi:ribosomal protein S18 acetylase RimI-like enzyme
MTLRLRRASLEDVPGLRPMMADFNRLEAIDWTFERGEGALRQLLSSAELGYVGLAQTEETLCGYFVLTFGYDLEWCGRDAFLTELYLIEAARGRGYGRRLLAEALAQAQSLGVRALHLVVRPENTAAFGLYLATGFRETERRLLTKRLVP